MKNKGFTLLELLGVIVILALIMILVFPKIINSIKSSSQKVDDTTLKLIYNATELYLDEHKDEYPSMNNFKYCISLNQLIDEEYLKESINLYESDSDITDSKSVLATYQDDYTFEVKDTDICQIEATYVCEAVTESKTGNVPQGDYNLGDEYICQVKNGTYYNFFVVSDSAKNVNLIMNRNINFEGEFADESNLALIEWISTFDYGVSNTSDLKNDKGPITVINILNNATSNWANIPNIEYFYIDEGGNYGSINLTGKARLLTYNEAIASGCISNTDDGLYENSWVSCPNWLVTNLTHCVDWNTIGFYCEDSYNIKYKNLTHISGIPGYWLISSSKNSNSATAIGWMGDIDIDSDTAAYKKLGIRPVISIPKTLIKN